MNRHLILLVLFVSITVFVSFLKDHRKKQKKILFFGDSITQAGVQSGGYIDILKSRFELEYPGLFELAGAGIGGNKVYDLYLRLEKDVISKSPQWVVVYVGINDVWHKQLLGTGTDLDKFQQFYEAVLKKLREAGIEVILCTPTLIGEKQSGSNCCDQDLEAYSQAIRKLGAQFDSPVVDLQTAFRNYETTNNTGNAESGLLTTDGVHLNATGNKLVADKIWDVLISKGIKK